MAYEAPKGAGQALVVTIAAKPNEWDDPVEFSLTLRPAAPSLNRLIAELASLKKKVEKLESEQSSASASCTSTFNADGAMLNALRGDLKVHYRLCCASDSGDQYYESALARLFKLEAAQPAAKPAKETTVLQVTARASFVVIMLTLLLGPIMQRKRLRDILATPTSSICWCPAHNCVIPK